MLHPAPLRPKRSVALRDSYLLARDLFNVYFPRKHGIRLSPPPEPYGSKTNRNGVLYIALQPVQFNRNQIMQCVNCNSDTKNPKFCSKSCSVSYNNKMSPKRIKHTHKCQTCDTLIYRRLKFCKKCNSRIPKDLTLREAQYLQHHKSSAFALVRTRARAVAKLHNMTTCQKCGYSKHVEIAHIKAISTYSEDALLSTINHPTNLMSLCPNCHWEFDHPALREGLEPT